MSSPVNEFAHSYVLISSQSANELKAAHEDRIIIGGLDVCQKLSGVTLKLLAFESLLTDYPVWRNKVSHTSINTEPIYLTMVV